MSRLICTSAIDGAVKWVARADAKLAQAMDERGEDHPVGLPDTTYFLPIIHSLSGHEVRTLADCREVLGRCKALLPARPAEHDWLPYLGAALDAGVAALYACEVIEACKYLIGPAPVDGIWLGAASDVIIRERGIEFVDGTAPGFAAVTGAAPSNEIAVQIARRLQQKNLYVFMAGATRGRQFAEQLAEEGVQLGWDTRLIPYGKDVSALVYALGFANRVALSFGNVRPGDFSANLKYNKDRVFAFVLALDEVDDDKYALAAGAINYGFPVIADTPIPQILPTGVCTYEHVVSDVPHESMVDRALEVRGCKVKITSVPVPVPYGPAFEGERIRKPDFHAELGGKRATAFEFVTSAEIDEIDDGEIEIVGPDIDAVEPGAALPLGIWVQVAGRKMQTDFEPILERQIHHLINSASGIWHIGQRDIVWTRVSKDAYARGFRLRHYGEILHAKLLADYPAIVDKVKVTLITEADEVQRRLPFVRQVWDERNRRLRTMTDESVDIFYSCLLCQSFAPNHVCIITPERLGLCGAYNWLDGKAAFEIDETGPNQPVRKGECTDPVKGVWRGVDDYVYIHSHKTVSSFSAYSIMDYPMTSCGCFEVICAYVPECNGVMVVNREYPGDTPLGMTFTSLAGSVGGGLQTPGFMGCGKFFLTSRKFLSAEGGLARLIWMPRELKTLLARDLRRCFERQGTPDLLDSIADETVSADPDEIRAYLERVGHPALDMPDMTNYARGEPAEDTPPEVGAPPPLAAQRQRATDAAGETEMTPEQLEQLKAEIASEVTERITGALKEEILPQLLAALGGKGPAPAPEQPQPAEAAPPRISAAQRLDATEAFEVPRETCEVPIWTVRLGATREEGGTRGGTVQVGGATAMPFHLWEGQMPHPPVVAMEVFDVVSPKYPRALRDVYGGLLEEPAQMAKACVEEHGADLISVRLEGTHPEKGGRSPAQAVGLVQAVLEAVDVPLIVTGHSHRETNNEVMKTVAKACRGERLLLNWTEQESFSTIAGAALAYDHCVVAQSPIDVNIAKQMNILITGLGLPREQIIIDPMTGAMGYGIEYTYSVMERIRLTALGGDAMLAGPMIVTPGQECAKIKELKAPREDFPQWGALEERAVLWELACATSLLYAGADVLVLYHPEAAAETRKVIRRLMDEE